MLRIRHCLTIALLTCVLAACGGDKRSSTEFADSAQIGAAISAAPWLRERLPDNTIAYVRIPSPWGLLSAPNGRAADALFASRAHVDVVQRIREGMASHPILAEVLRSDTADSYLRAFSSIAAPIEIAVIDPTGTATATAQMLLSTVLTERDPVRVAAHLDHVLGNSDASAASVSFDAYGYGEVRFSPATIQVHFNPSSGRLHALGGMGPSREQLHRLLAGIGAHAPRAHALHMLESEIDTGGQGLLLWLDMNAIRPWLAMASGGDRNLARAYEPIGSLAFGWGSVDGHGRMSLRAQVNDPAWLPYLPQTPRRLDIASSGTPGFILSLAIPTAQDVDRILAAIERDFGAEAISAWNEVNAFVAQHTQLTLRDWLAPFGPELLAFNDDAGFFGAVRIHDRDALQRVLDTLARLGEYRTRRINGREIHHLSYRSSQWADLPQSASHAGLNTVALLGWLQNLPRHGYWMQEGDWLITAKVPQPLMERALLGTDRSLEQTLREQLGDDRRHALLSASTHLHHLSRWYYHLYLGLLANLGDIAGVPVDLFELPTARQLQLPSRTGIGLAVVADGDRIAIDLNYEMSALDALMSVGGGYGSIAAAGMLAAIAVPSYQDYRSRSLVAQAISSAMPLRLAISEHFATFGALPSARDVADHLDIPATGVPAQILFESGAIRIRFTEGAPGSLAGTQLYLRPYRSPGDTLHFICGLTPTAPDEHALIQGLDTSATTTPAKLLPAHCRP